MGSDKGHSLPGCKNAGGEVLSLPDPLQSSWDLPEGGQNSRLQSQIEQVSFRLAD